MLLQSLHAVSRLLQTLNPKLHKPYNPKPLLLPPGETEPGGAGLSNKHLVQNCEI